MINKREESVYFLLQVGELYLKQDSRHGLELTDNPDNAWKIEAVVFDRDNEEANQEEIEELFNYFMKKKKALEKALKTQVAIAVRTIVKKEDITPIRDEYLKSIIKVKKYGQ